MKRTTLLLCLFASACATTRVAQPWPGFEPAPSSPARAVHRMTLGRLPPMHLREMALGTSLDALAHGSLPSTTGDVLCATSATAAAWQSPATCGLSTGTNYWTKSTRELDGAGGQLKLTDTTDEARFIGWTSYPTTGTNKLYYRFGDDNTGIGAASGKRLTIWSWHGVEVWGGEAGTIPAPATGSGSSDPSLAVIGAPAASGGPALRIDKNVSGTITAGAAISFSGRVTSSRASASIAANTCAALSTATLTGVVLGAECDAAVGTADSLSIQPTCQVDGANSIRWKICNPTAAAITYPASGSVTLSCRCWNP